MPKYSYVALDAHGKETKGNIEVASQNEAIGRVKEMGLFPTRIVESEKPRKRSPGKTPGHRGGPAAKSGALDLQIRIPGLSGRVKPKVLMAFTRQLATLVDAGLPLLRGLRMLEKQERNSTLRGILAELALAIEGGSTFSEALAQHPKIFNRIFVNMVKAGELGSVLEVVLKRLAEFSKRRRKSGQRQSRHVLSRRGADARDGHHDPADDLCVPRFQQVFAGMMNRAPFPGFTLFVLGIGTSSRSILWRGHQSRDFRDRGLMSLKTRIGRLAWDKFKLKVPVIGPVVSKVALPVYPHPRRARQQRHPHFAGPNYRQGNGRKCGHQQCRQRRSRKRQEGESPRA